MYKIALLSILVAAFVVPAVTARDVDPRRGVERTVLWIVLFNIAYVVGVLIVYPYLRT